MRRTSEDALSWSATGTRLFLDAVAGWGEEQYLAPSGLPGWTRKHLVAHVAANADALSNLVRWAATGEETPMYSSMEQRNADIEAGSAKPAAELAAWLQGSADRLTAGRTRRSCRAACAERPASASTSAAASRSDWRTDGGVSRRASSRSAIEASRSPAAVSTRNPRAISSSTVASTGSSGVVPVRTATASRNHRPQGASATATPRRTHRCAVVSDEGTPVCILGRLVNGVSGNWLTFAGAGFRPVHREVSQLTTCSSPNRGTKVRAAPDLRCQPR